MKCTDAVKISMPVQTRTRNNLNCVYWISSPDQIYSLIFIWSSVIYINNNVTWNNAEIIITIRFTKICGKLGRQAVVYGYDPINSLNGAKDRLVKKWKDRLRQLKKARVNARSLERRRKTCCVPITCRYIEQWELVGHFNATAGSAVCDVFRDDTFFRKSITLQFLGTESDLLSNR